MTEPRSPALQADFLPSKPPGKPKNTGVGTLTLLQGIFPTQESNRGLLHCRLITSWATREAHYIYCLDSNVFSDSANGKAWGMLNWDWEGGAVVVCLSSTSCKCCDLSLFLFSSSWIPHFCVPQSTIVNPRICHLHLEDEQWWREPLICHVVASLLRRP